MPATTVTGKGRPVMDSIPPTFHRGYQRCSRIDYADGGNAFAVTLCVNPRRPVFTSADRCQPVIDELKHLQDEGFMGVYLFCIMPDHIHLVVNPGPTGLPEAVRRLKGRLSVWWREAGDGQSLWQSSYFDHRIRSSESFNEKCAYVLQNPVRAGLVKTDSEYPWTGSFAVR